MRNKTLICSIIFLFVVFSLSTYAETKKLREIGRYKFISIKGDVSAEEVMNTLVKNYRGDIKYGFDLVGTSRLFVPFIEQLEQSGFQEKELAVGDKMQWMLFRSQGKIKAVHDLEWAGKRPLPVYSLSVNEGGRYYEFIMPKSCGNIALQKVETSLPGEFFPPEKTYEEQKDVEASQEELQEIEKAKIYREIYPLLNETDLYCSFFVLDGEKPDTKIIGAEREYERVQFTNGDIVYINKGRADGIEEGQIFLAMERGRASTRYGPVVYKRGRVRVLALEENAASARVEKACGPVMLGNYLVPFREREGRMGKDLGYNVPPYENEGAKGEIIYLQREYFQAGSGAWALIDLGESSGIQLGQQLVVYRKHYEGVPLQIFANLVVIDTQKETSTVKILSCEDALIVGDLVQAR